MKTKKLFTTVAAGILFLTMKAGNESGPNFFRVSDISVSSAVSGNGFGLHYNTSLNFFLGKNLTLGGGPSFNSQHNHMTGYSFNTKYFVMRPEESFSGHGALFATASVHRIMNDKLCSSSLQREQMAADARNTHDVDFCRLRYNGWEYSAGFGAAYYFNFGLLLKTGFALSYYSVDQVGNHPVETYHNNSALSLRLTAGIGWNFDRQSTAKKRDVL